MCLDPDTLSCRKFKYERETDIGGRSLGKIIIFVFSNLFINLHLDGKC